MSTNTLESRGHVATEDDIRTLASDFVAALSSANGSKLHYLRALIGTTVHELGAPSRQRSIQGAKIKDDDVRTQHLAALESVHGRFYTVIKETTAKELAHLPSAGGKRGDEVNRKCNYARTALYAIRGWMRAGNDITTLAPGKVTKESLDIPNRPRRRPSTSRLTTRAESQTRMLFATMKTLAAVDKEAAAGELDALMKRIAAMAVELRGAATKDPRRASAEGVPLRAAGQLFMPASRMR